MAIHHYLFEIAVSDKRYLFELRDLLLESGCVEKYSGDLNVYYGSIFSCRDAAIFLGYSKIIYVDILSNSEAVDGYFNLLMRVIPKNKIMIHYVVREV